MPAAAGQHAHDALSPVFAVGGAQRHAHGHLHHVGALFDQSGEGQRAHLIGCVLLAEIALGRPAAVGMRNVGADVLFRLPCEIFFGLFEKLVVERLKRAGMNARAEGFHILPAEHDADLRLKCTVLDQHIRPVGRKDAPARFHFGLPPRVRQPQPEILRAAVLLAVALEDERERLKFAAMDGIIALDRLVRAAFAVAKRRPRAVDLRADGLTDAGRRRAEHAEYVKIGNIQIARARHFHAALCAGVHEHAHAAPVLLGGHRVGIGALYVVMGQLGNFVVRAAAVAAVEKGLDDGLGIVDSLKSHVCFRLSAPCSWRRVFIL